LNSITYLALGEHWLDVWPCLALGGITEEVHDDGTLVDGGVDIEEVLALNPAITLRLFPAGAALSHTDDDIEAVVAEVEALTVTLRAVSDQGEGVVLEVLLLNVSEPVPRPMLFRVIIRTRSFSRGQSSRSVCGVSHCRPKITLDPPTENLLLVAGEVDSLRTADLLREGRGDGLLCGNEARSAGVDSGNERALLHLRCLELSQ
jgi:hypothetical protein